MNFIEILPVWGLALLVFGLRIIDVSLGTLRIFAVVQGRVFVSVALGFVEILIWVTAVSQVIANLQSSPLLVLGYAGGFAAGNGIGILLQHRFAAGPVVLRLVTTKPADEIVDFMRARGAEVIRLTGRGDGGAEEMVYATVDRRHVERIVNFAERKDPEVFSVVEPVLQVRPKMYPPFPYLSSLRSVFVRK